MLNKINLHYTNTVIYSIIAACITLAISFGLHLSQDNIHSILTLVGLILGTATAGAGAKTAGLIRARVPTESTGFHFTPATLTAIIGAAITLAVSFGLHLTQENISSIMTLVGLLAGGIIVGGAAKSHAMLRQGVHPIIQDAPPTHRH